MAEDVILVVEEGLQEVVWAVEEVIIKLQNKIKYNYFNKKGKEN